MKVWLIQLSALTPEQKKMVENSPRENILISGPPGSGKTQVLVHRAAFFLRSQGLSLQDIRLFVSTDVLEELIGGEIERLGYPREMVMTFDHWCRSFFVTNISKDLPRIYIDGRIDYRKTRFAVLEALKKNEKWQKRLEFALVDDGQDLTPEAIEVLALASRYVTVSCDSLQGLKTGGTSESFILEALKINKGDSALEGDFRSSPSVAHLAARFIIDDDLRYAYLSQARTAQVQKEAPLCFVAGSEEKEILHFSRIVRQKMVQKNRVGILVPTNSLVHSLARSLLEKGIETEKAIPADAQNVIHSPYDFRNHLPKITTYSMAKGLTFDGVLLPRLTENSFSTIPSNRRNPLFFSGISRASLWVYLSTVKEQEFREMTTLRSAQTDGYLRIVNRAGPGLGPLG